MKSVIPKALPVILELWISVRNSDNLIYAVQQWERNRSLPFSLLSGLVSTPTIIDAPLIFAPCATLTNWKC